MEQTLEVGCCDDAGGIVVDGQSQPVPLPEYDLPFVPREDLIGPVLVRVWALSGIG